MRSCSRGKSWSHFVIFRCLAADLMATLPCLPRAFYPAISPQTLDIDWTALSPTIQYWGNTNKHKHQPPTLSPCQHIGSAVQHPTSFCRVDKKCYESKMHILKYKSKLCWVPCPLTQSFKESNETIYVWLFKFYVCWYLHIMLWVNL